MRLTRLAIGIDPAVVDYSVFPGLTAELVAHFIETQIAKPPKRSLRRR
jgi:hypothetical protein